MNKIIPIEIYNTDMLLVIGSKEELKSALEEHLDKEEAEETYNVMSDDMDDISLGKSVLLNNGTTVLWLLSNEDKGTMAHEIFHIAYFIMEKVGIGLCHKSDEAYTYLIGYITSKIEEELKLQDK